MFNLLVVLGPTASGKTHLAVQLARAFRGEILSADSRQVYRELTIGSGKDLGEYTLDGISIPYHLIDITTLDHEFSVFDFQQQFYAAFESLQSRTTLPILVGGTGLFLEAALSGRRMLAVPRDDALRQEITSSPNAELISVLQALKPLHNSTDLHDRDRLIRALEIALYEQVHVAPPAPDIRPFILGIRWPRPELHARIDARLRQRLNNGMIEEVRDLLAAGIAPARLRLLGLEYRYITDHLEGLIKSRNDLRQKLQSAIADFAKRQETWFRRMEKQGHTIHWIDRADAEAAITIVAKTSFRH